MASLQCFTLMIFLSLVVSATANKQVYIVHIDHHSKPDSFTTHHDWYASIIQSVTSTPSHDSHIYTYTTAFHGFAAHLQPHEADLLKEMESVIDVHEDKIYTVQTTRTPEFLGIDHSAKFGGVSFAEIDEKSHNFVVGMIDSGVWPESKSFDDNGMPEVPKNWKGKCEAGPDFDPEKHCNRKLIGARVFLNALLKLNHSINASNISPRDIDGHGTHTASIAAGSPVANASLFGYAAGTARGMAPRARLASYKVCLGPNCTEADILQGITQAAEDGVTVISASLGLPGIRPYYDDPIAKAAFTAIQMGVLVSCAAGNGGADIIINVAPWITSVGAGSLDRTFPGYVSLGNNMSYLGFSISGEDRGSSWGMTKGKLVYLNGTNTNSSNLCFPGSLEPAKVRGKIVVCDVNSTAIPTVRQALAVKEAGAVGLITANTASDGELPTDRGSHVLPAVFTGHRVGDLIREYATRDSEATATLSYGKTEVDVKPSPFVAYTSSRGPNKVTPQILKPDLIAPGFLVLAAWPDILPVSYIEANLVADKRRSDFNILSGTSMSTPHISGLAILLKAAHPEWSPSAIKSALMTTARTMDNTNSPILDNLTSEYATPFALGSGYVNPQKAVSPGLVYDISREEYTMFLCSLNYTLRQVKSIVLDPNVTCSKRFSDPGELNYPSLSVVFGHNKRVVTYSRELTNVGEAGSVYEADLDAPRSVNVTVRPARLVFEKEGDKRSFTVILESFSSPTNVSFGSLVWRNQEHQVRSPIVAMWS